VKYGLLQENNGTAQYTLGLSVLKLGLLAQRNLNLAVLARSIMKELSLKTGETVLLTVVHGTKGMVLERVESEEPIRYSLFQPGAAIPLHAGASSKILMAYLGEEDWERIIAREGLRRYTASTITQVRKLKAHLRDIRKKGYAVSDQEVDRDVRAVAAPILNGAGELVAGLSVAGPAYRINLQKVDRMRSLVVKGAMKISSMMGYNGPKPVRTRR